MQARAGRREESGPEYGRLPVISMLVLIMEGPIGCAGEPLMFFPSFFVISGVRFEKSTYEENLISA